MKNVKKVSFNYSSKIKGNADPMKGLNAFGAQLSLAPSEGISAYLNFMDGSVSGTIVDLTATFQLIPLS